MKALLLLLLLGPLKLGKLGAMALSMLLSFGVYGQMWGWRFAAGFLGLLLVHELGHWAAARRHGLDVGLPTFVPFVGAWIELKDRVLDPRVEAEVAIAGPLTGTLVTIAVYFLARQDGDRLLLAVAWSGLVLNLFNLLPLAPLDGGRVTQILTPRIWFLGAPLALACLLWRPSPILLMVLILAIPSLVAAWHYDPDAPENAARRALSFGEKAEYVVLYLGLTGFLAVMTLDVHELLAGRVP